MPRGKGSQSRHDAAVRREAQKLADQGFEVKADVTGFPQPDTVGGLRPDIDAKKGSERKIIEYETPASLKDPRAEKQKEAFKEAADRSKNTKFVQRVVRPKKRR